MIKISDYIDMQKVFGCQNDSFDLENACIHFICTPSLTSQFINELINYSLQVFTVSYSYPLSYKATNRKYYRK
jgi:hypothetical protein